MSQKAPPFLAMTVICLKRICWPPPQALEQAPQAAQGVWAQSTEHACVLHVCSAVEGPQGLPPYSKSVFVARARVDLPVPHVVLQAVQAVQPDCTQSTGHGELLHVFSSVRIAGHALPPAADAVVTLLERRE